jgi:hypothetical protein
MTVAVVLRIVRRVTGKKAGAKKRSLYFFVIDNRLQVAFVRLIMRIILNYRKNECISAYVIAYGNKKYNLPLRMVPIPWERFTSSLDANLNAANASALYVIRISALSRKKLYLSVLRKIALA